MGIYSSKTYISDLDVCLAHVVGLDKLNGKTVLITGATGTIGSFVTDVLLRYNETGRGKVMVYAAGRNVDRLNKQYATHFSFKALSYDINREIYFNVRSDYIMHMAGNAHPTAFGLDPVGTLMGTVNSTYNLLEYGRKHYCKRLLYVSSGEVYGKGDLSLEEFDENYAGYLNPQEVRSCYPMAKRTAENICASYSKQYGLDTVVVRPCHTYGPCITVSDSRAHAQFIRNAIRDEDITLKSPGTQMRSYNYVADCASAILTVLLNGKSSESYNIANSQAKCSIADLAKLIADEAGVKARFAKPTDEEISNRIFITRQILSSKKIESLGWKGAFSLKLGINHTLKILKDIKQ